MSPSTTTEPIQTLGEFGAVPFARIGPETGDCLGDCGKETPLAFLGDKSFRTYCPGCDEAAEARREAADRAEIAVALRERAGVPPRMASWTLASYPSDASGVAARAASERWASEYLEGDRKNLLLWGDIGVGKTGLCVGLVNLLVEENVAARIVNWRKVLLEMKQAFAERRPVRDDWKRIRLLVVDDVGSERPTEWAREEFLDLVDYRWSHDLATVYTLNFPVSRLAARLSPDDEKMIEGRRIVSRMQDGATVVHIEGRDRRV